MVANLLRKFRTWLTAIATICILSVPISVLASTYGSGSYGGCTYNNGCSTSSPSSTSSNSQTPLQAPTQTSSTILLNNFNEFFSVTGKELVLSVNQVIYFDVTTNGATVRHSITIKAIGSNYIDITIAPNPITDRLYVGDTKQYDVNGDGQKDIQITLNSISTSGQADVTFKALSPAVAATPAIKTAPTAKSHSWWWIIIFSAIAAIGILWFIIFWIKRRKQQSPWTQP